MDNIIEFLADNTKSKKFIDQLVEESKNLPPALSDCVIKNLTEICSLSVAEGYKFELDSSPYDLTKDQKEFIRSEIEKIISQYENGILEILMRLCEKEVQLCVLKDKK
jgi:hypothetical protein